MVQSFTSSKKVSGLACRASLLALAVWALPVEAIGQDYVPGEVIVKLKNHGPGKQSQKTESFKTKMWSKGADHKKSWDELNLHKFEARGGKSTEDLLTELKSDPEVEYAEPNYFVKKQAEEVSGQAVSYSQVGSFVSGFGLTSAPMMGVEAWSEVTAANTPVVAVIDTGVDLYHPALEDAIWVNTDEIANNGVDDDGNGFVDDRYGWNFADGNNYTQDCDGHGTHVSGIVRGTTQYIFDPQNLGAPLIRIMPVKFLDCYGSGSTAGAIDAIYYAVSNGAKILNNSWGGGSYSRALHEAILYSYNAQTLFVAAAGNAANNNDANKTYPASYDVPNVISVAATNSSDYLASFSNYGSTLVHVASPGYNILSTYLNYGGCPPTEGCFTWLSGTSMAAPFVAGIAALISNEKPGMNGYQMKGIIQATVDTKSQLASKVSTSGRVNSNNSVVTAKASAVNPYMPFYEIGLSTEDRGLASELALGGTGGCGLVNIIGRGGPGSGGGIGRGTPWGLLFAISIVLMAPILMGQWLKVRGQRRVHQRFEVSSSAQIRIGGEDVVANLSSISVGGVGLETKTLLETGSLLTLNIQTPDGQNFEVRGKVVWQRQNEKYGVQFQSATGAVREAISRWTKGLVPQKYYG